LAEAGVPECQERVYPEGRLVGVNAVDKLTVVFGQVFVAEVLEKTGFVAQGTLLPMPVNKISSILNWQVLEVLENRILKLEVAGMVPEAVT